MTKIIFATGNKGKLREAREILGPEFELLSSADVGIIEDIPEPGATIKENSILKAEYVYDHTGLNCFADDTGLEVDALGGAPGVHAARYAYDIALRNGHPIAETHDFDKNIEALLSELAKHPGEPRTARFRSVVTLILDGQKHFFEGTLEGRIAFERHGAQGFGYDPVFIPNSMANGSLSGLGINGPFPDGHLTVAELGEDVKNAISHRGQALRALAEWLKI